MPESDTTSPSLLRTFVGPQLIGRVVTGVAIIVSTGIAASAWYKVKSPPETIRVTGSATKRIDSDLIEWDASVRHSAPRRADAYRKVAADVEKTVAYLEEKGISTEDIRISSVDVNAYYETKYEQIAEEAVGHSELAGYTASQRITVTSEEVEKVEKVSREVTALLDRNIPIESSSPQYHYTKLEDLKVEMLAAAAADARTRAEHILDAAGDSKPGEIIETHMGVININPANSTATSWEGNNDKSSYEKDIITVVHAVYAVD